MSDVDELFQASIDLEVPDDQARIDLREDELVDIAQLVEEWNEGHTGAGSPDRRSRLTDAREAIAEHIGSHPEEDVTPPAPDPDSTSGLDDWRAGHAASVADARVHGDDEVSPRLSWRDRRRARREIDRLQRDAGASDSSGAVSTEPGDVTIVEAPETHRPQAPADARPGASGMGEGVPEADSPPTDAGQDADETPDASPAATKVRYPIFTRSVLVWLFIFLCVGLAFGATGAFWWAHFNSEVEQLRSETTSFTDQVENAAGAIETQRLDALGEINTAVNDLSRLAAAAGAVIEAGDHADSVWSVTTLDEDGVASVGSAFVVANEAERSLLLTALEPVRASTVEPGPEITLHNGDRQLRAELWSWDPALDLALLIVDDPELPALDWATDDEVSVALGSGIYVLSGLGADGAAATNGQIIDQSTVGMQHTAPVGTAFRGGPIMTGDDKVLGIATLSYTPLGFDPGSVLFAPPIAAACNTVLVCSVEGSPVAGDAGGDPVVADPPPAAPDGDGQPTEDAG